MYFVSLRACEDALKNFFIFNERRLSSLYEKC